MPDRLEDNTKDADSDGTPDFQDTDSDNDNVPDAEEGTGDSDSDGIDDDLDPDADGVGRPVAVCVGAEVVVEERERGDDTASAACTSILYRVCYDPPQ